MQVLHTWTSLWLLYEVTYIPFRSRACWKLLNIKDWVVRRLLVQWRVTVCSNLRVGLSHPAHRATAALWAGCVGAQSVELLTVLHSVAVLPSANENRNQASVSSLGMYVLQTRIRPDPQRVDSSSFMLNRPLEQPLISSTADYKICDIFNSASCVIW